MERIEGSMAPVEDQASPVAEKFSDKRRITLPFLLLAIILSSLLSIVGTLLVMTRFVSSDMIPENKSLDATVSNTLTPTQTVLLEGYPKRLYNPNEKYFNDYDYPNSLTSLPDSELVGLKCGFRYVRVEDGWVETKDSMIRLIDQKDLDLIGSLIKVAKTNIETFQKCLTDDGRTLVTYGIEAGGGGSENTHYFSFVSSNNELINPTKAKNNGAPYWSCHNPLQLTISDVLYYNCGGGDGGGAFVSIYEIDLGNRNSKVLYECSSHVAFEGGNSTVVCQ